MRILRVSDIYDRSRGGMRHYVMHSSAELEALGHKVDHLWRDDLLPSVTHAGLRRLLIPWLIALKCASRAKHCDVIEIHEPLGAPYGILTRLLSRRALPPLAILSHGLEARSWSATRARARHLRRNIPLKSRILVPLTLVTQAVIAIRAADVVVVLSSEDARYVIDRLRVPRARVVMAPSGIHNAFLHIDRPEHDSDSIRVVFVGAWIDRKGIRELSHAWCAVHADPRLHLILAGTIVDTATVQASLPAYARDRVTIIPKPDQARIRQLLARCDIFVLPSWFEGMPLTALEAAASGLPCVVTRICGLLDLFPPAESEALGALTIPPHDAVALAHAVQRLASDAALRHVLGDRARQRAAAFTWRRSAEQLSHAYSVALASRNA